MFTNHNIKYIYEKKAENGSREKDKIFPEIILNSTLVLSAIMKKNRK